MAVLNKHHHGGKVPDGAVNIMRGTKWGNPFPVTVGGYTRAEAVEKYRRTLWRQIQGDPEFAAEVKALYGRDLCCCCAPLACHGDVLARAAEWLNNPA